MVLIVSYQLLVSTPNLIIISFEFKLKMYFEIVIKRRPFRIEIFNRDKTYSWFIIVERYRLINLF